MISQDIILNGVCTLLASSTAITTVCGAAGRIVKGSKRPDGLPNPCLTVNVPNMGLPGGWWGGQNALVRTQTGAVVIVAFCDLYANGAINATQLATMTTAVGSLLASSKPTITGANVHRVGDFLLSGPLYDPQDPQEAYAVVQVGLWINETS